MKHAEDPRLRQLVALGLFPPSSLGDLARWREEDGRAGEALFDFLERVAILRPGASRQLEMARKGYLQLKDPQLLLRLPLSEHGAWAQRHAGPLGGATSSSLPTARPRGAPESVGGPEGFQALERRASAAIDFTMPGVQSEAKPSERQTGRDSARDDQTVAHEPLRPLPGGVKALAELDAGGCLRGLQIGEQAPSQDPWFEKLLGRFVATWSALRLGHTEAELLLDLDGGEGLRALCIVAPDSEARFAILEEDADEASVAAAMHRSLTIPTPASSS